jgi:ribose 5-phosphate isomerase B
MNQKPHLLIAADHAGFELKKFLTERLKTQGYDVEDMGAHTLVPGDDYPRIMAPVGLRIAERADTDDIRAIVIGGSGNGEAIMCNRFPGVRAAVWYGGSLEVIRHSRDDNNSNILSLGARYMTQDEAWQAVQLWLETPFSGEERHERRNELIDAVV